MYPAIPVELTQYVVQMVVILVAVAGAWLSIMIQGRI
jgi:hypothetical protein